MNESINAGINFANQLCFWVFCYEPPLSFYCLNLGLFLSASVWSIFGVGPDIDPEILRPLANHSLLLLLILPNQLTRDTNPYREVMFNCKGQRSFAKDRKNHKGQPGEFRMGISLDFQWQKS